MDKSKLPLRSTHLVEVLPVLTGIGIGSPSEYVLAADVQISVQGFLKQCPGAYGFPFCLSLSGVAVDFRWVPLQMRYRGLAGHLLTSFRHVPLASG